MFVKQKKKLFVKAQEKKKKRKENALIYIFHETLILPAMYSIISYPIR